MRRVDPVSRTVGSQGRDASLSALVSEGNIYGREVVLRERSRRRVGVRGGE